MSFDRTCLPEPTEFYPSQGMTLSGKGQWQKTLCPFHNDKTPSLSINTKNGAFYCFSCGAKGGDMISFLMQRDHLDFIEAVKMLGAWREESKNGKSRTEHDQHRKPAPLSARDALAVLKQESLICVIVAQDIAAGKNVPENDLQRMYKAAGRIQTIQEVFP